MICWLAIRDVENKIAKIWGAANKTLINGITKYNPIILSVEFKFLFLNATIRSEIHIDKHDINPIGWEYMERVIRRTESIQYFEELPSRNLSDESQNSIAKEKDNSV